MSAHAQRTRVAELLIDLEAVLRNAGHWARRPPSDEALQSTLPFCIDTMAFPVWLQYLYLPRMRHVLEQGQPLPATSDIAPMAELWQAEEGVAVMGLVETLRRLDRAMNAG